MWPRGSVQAKVAQLQGTITATRAQQRDLQHRLEEAVTVELRALAQLDSAQAIQTECRAKIDECAAAISSMQDAIADLVPKPRSGG